ncbi:MAG: cobalamin biosynthesis protein CbiG [Methylococcales bacterium]|nr:cobalamin biosynthesis protein CbiG [Methylococcales bacterium]
MNTTEEPRIVLVAITKHGVAKAVSVAEQLPEATLAITEKFADKIPAISNQLDVLPGKLSANIGPLFDRYDQVVMFISLGAVVRLIAPHLKSKDEDPGVIVIDDAGRFIIPVLSGHVGGANAFAEKLAVLTGGEAVLTTASDVGKTIPVDILGRELGWKVEAPKINITRVSAHVVNEEPVAFVQETGSRDWWTRPTPLPKNIHLFNHFDDVDLSHFKAVLWVTEQEISAEQWRDLDERLVVYRPPAGQH